MRIFPPCSATASRPLPSGIRSTHSGESRPSATTSTATCAAARSGRSADPPGLRDGPAGAVEDGSPAVVATAAVPADGVPRSPHAWSSEREDGERDHRDAESDGADDVHGSA